MKKKLLYLLTIIICFGFLIMPVSADLTVDPYENNGFDSAELEAILGIDNNDDETESSDDNCPFFVVVDSSGAHLSDFYYFLQDIFNLIKLGAPALVIVLSLIDYLGAIAKSNDDEVKKASQRTIKRVIVGLLIFFLPFILDLLFQIFNLTDITRCGIGT